MLNFSHKISNFAKFLLIKLRKILHLKKIIYLLSSFNIFIFQDLQSSILCTTKHVVTTIPITQFLMLHFHEFGIS